MIITSAFDRDAEHIHELVSKIDGLVTHPLHFYKIMIHYFGNTFFVARDNSDLAGLVWGFVSQTNREILFLWQIGVAFGFRGKNVSDKLIESFIAACRTSQCKKVHATVETTNTPSIRLFERTGFRNATYGDLLIENNRRAMPNYYGTGTNQILFEFTV